MARNFKGPARGDHSDDVLGKVDENRWEIDSSRRFSRVRSRKSTDVASLTSKIFMVLFFLYK